VVFGPLPRRAEFVFVVNENYVNIAFFVNFEEKKRGFGPVAKILNKTLPMVRPKMGSELPQRETLSQEQRAEKFRRTLEKKRAAARARRERWRRRQGMKKWGTDPKKALARKRLMTRRRVQRYRERSALLQRRWIKALLC